MDSRHSSKIAEALEAADTVITEHLERWAKVPPHNTPIGILQLEGEFTRALGKVRGAMQAVASAVSLD
jgi:hypothetical protein